MLDIIGNIKINESIPNRIDFLIASLRSCYIFNPNIILNLETPSDKLYNTINTELSNSGCDYHLQKSNKSNYGKLYCDLINQYSKHDYILNFIEDHFITINDYDTLNNIMLELKSTNTDICKSTFFNIEQNSSNTLTSYNNTKYGKYFINSRFNYQQYCRHYGRRFYIGVNFITSKSFALKFWNRNIDSMRPHEYEIIEYDSNFEHRCMIPNIEIQCSIDDDHGDINSCLLKKSNDKFNQIWKLEMNHG